MIADYSLDRQAFGFYGSFAVTEDIKVGMEYAGDGSGELAANILYQVAWGGLSSLDVGIGLSVTTPIRAYIVVRGVNYVSSKAFLHSSAAYKVSPSPSELKWSIGVGYDFSDTVFGVATYRDTGMTVGFGLRF